MKLEIKHSVVLSRNMEALQDANMRFILNMGGSRSSKTYSLCQLLIVWCLSNPKILVSIVRKSFPSLRTSVMRDFISVLKDLDIYEVKNHHKTENIYNFPNGSSVEFFSVDDEQKLRGRKRNIITRIFNEMDTKSENNALYDNVLIYL